MTDDWIEATEGFLRRAVDSSVALAGDVDPAEGREGLRPTPEEGRDQSRKASNPGQRPPPPERALAPVPART